MEKNEPFFSLNTPDGKFEARQDNTTLFQHLGHAALDHIFVTADEDRGMYIWSDHDQYEEIMKIVVDEKCTMVLNIQQPSEVDVRAYMSHHTTDKDECPDWLPEC